MLLCCVKCWQIIPDPALAVRNLNPELPLPKRSPGFFLPVEKSSYDQTYYGPAFKLLEDPGACDRIGPTAKPLIRRLIQMGGCVSLVIPVGV